MKQAIPGVDGGRGALKALGLRPSREQYMDRLKALRDNAVVVASHYKVSSVAMTKLRAEREADTLRWAIHEIECLEVRISSLCREFAESEELS